MTILKPPKLVTIIGSLDLGGTEKHLCQVMPRLQGDNLDITVIAFRTRGVLAAEMEAQNVCVLSPPGPQWLENTTLIRRAFIFLWLGVMLARQRPDIVLFFLPEAYLLGGFWAVLLGSPIRIMSRRSLNFYQRKHPLLSFLERCLHKKMHALVGNSKAVIQNLETETKGTARSIQLMYNGIDPKDFISKRSVNEIRREIGISSNAFVLIQVANFIPYKGHRDLLEALASVQRRLPNPWRLICVGRDDGILDQLKSFADQLNIGGSVVWLEDRRDIADLMAISHVGLSSSHEEGLSNSVLEGMAVGLPMIVTDVGGNPELVVHNETGLVVPPRNSLAFGNACISLANDATLRASMGRSGLKRSLSRFSYLDLYQSLVIQWKG